MAPPNRSSTSSRICSAGVPGQQIGCAEDGERPVAEVLVDVPAGVDDGRHDDLEKRVEVRDGVFCGVGFREGGEVANVDEHDGDLDAFAGEDVVALFEQASGEGWIDVGAEGRPQAFTFGQTGLHPVE